jgi:hypothetical protein
VGPDLLVIIAGIPREFEIVSSFFFLCAHL